MHDVAGFPPDQRAGDLLGLLPVFERRRRRGRTVNTSVCARLSGVIISSSFQAAIGSPIWRKPAAVFRWSWSVEESGIDRHQVIVDQNK